MSELTILWHSNSEFAATGYGVQTGLFVRRLAALGHTVIESAFYGLHGAVLKLDGVQILPGSKDAYGNDMLLAHQQFWQADLVLSLVDLWVLNPELLRRLPVYAWAPVDHDPVPTAVVQSGLACRRVIAMSRWGQARFREAGIDAAYVPHGVDTHVFRPTDRASARQRLGAPEASFIAGMVMANKGAPSRKAFDQQIRAFARFHARHPDSLLYLHTDLRGWQGENLERLLELAGLPPAAVSVVPQYEYLNGMLGASDVAVVYNAIDVLLNATRGEGFGVPILEAQACGTPVIVTDFSAMPELVFAGEAVAYLDKVFTPQGSYQVIPSVDAIDAALERAYQQRGSEGVRDAARAGALDYDADRVTAAYWVPLLEEAAREVRPPSVEDKREARRQRQAARRALVGSPAQ